MSIGDIEIRPAQAADAPALARYARALYAERLPTMFLHDTAPTPDEERSFIEGFAPPNALLLVARQGDQAVAMLGFRGHARPQLTHSGVIGFGVTERFRRRGIARALFAALNRWAESGKSLSRIECDVFSTNIAALSLLGSLGFTREGTMRRAIEVEGALIDNHLMARVW